MKYSLAIYSPEADFAEKTIESDDPIGSFSVGDIVNPWWRKPEAMDVGTWVGSHPPVLQVEGIERVVTSSLDQTLLYCVETSRPKWPPAP